jgi:hypothetical protein
LLESSDTVHPAPEIVKSEAATAVSWPVVVPLTAERAKRTGESGVFAGAPTAVLALMVVVTNPTGSVVAVV